MNVLVAALTGRPLQTKLRRIVLGNVGGKGDGTPIEGEIAAQILGPMMKQARAAATGMGTEQYQENRRKM